MTATSNSTKIKIWKNIFFYQVSSSEQKTQKKLRSFWKHLLTICVLIFIIYLFSTYSYKTTNHFGIELFKKNFLAIFSFSNISTLDYEQNLIIRSLSVLWFTIKYTISGTFIGFLLALLTSSLTNRNFTNKIWSFFSRNIILFLRCIPELLFITLFTSIYRAEFSLMLIFIWFTWLWLHKYYIEALESIDTRPFYVSINQGNSKIKSFYKEILPRLINRFISLFIYSFESNMRWGSILSSIGAPGIGILVNYAGQTTSRFKQLAIPLLVLLIFIILLEILNMLLNKYLFQINTRKLKTTDINKLSKTINIRFWIKLFIVLMLGIFSIYVISVTDKSYILSKSSTRFFRALLSPDWQAFNWSSLDIKTNPLLQILQIIIFAISTMTITIILSILIIPFCSMFTNKFQSTIIFRGLNSVNRLIPTVVLIYLFSALSSTPSKITLIVFVLGIHEASGFIKQISEVVDNIDEWKIKNLQLMGNSKFRIYFKFILPTIKYDFITLAIFYFEMAIRNAIIYSVFTTSQNSLYLGRGLMDALNERSLQVNIASVYFWCSTLTIFLLNIISEQIINNLKNKKKN
ncbi:ABC transporter permease subunit [Mycoplasma zalophi]|uniref:ABC transporter permease subunit n=1 Tax=Mycoplasma zalophi TaxID=191287 RepID=A0ABS6DQL4_9MOLU|nr:ABC transporter permease subunit [Mycoplasma zalophi]MBU4692066.1 ABC transporter permease subunit [Mycoplasma zalophi]